MDVFIGADFLITIQGCDSEKRLLLGDLERIVKRDIESARQGPAFLLHVILDHMVDQKFLVIEALEEEIDKSEEAMLDDLSSYRPAELFRLRQKLVTLRKSLFHEREILVRICRKDCPFITEKAIFSYRDIYDHLTKSYELTEACRDHGPQVPGNRAQPKQGIHPEKAMQKHPAAAIPSLRGWWASDRGCV